MLGMTMHDVHMNYLPLFHIYAYAEITLAAALVGAKQIMMDVFDAERALDLAEQERATVLHGTVHLVVFAAFLFLSIVP